jgi:hypothetical protein
MIPHAESAKATIKTTLTREKRTIAKSSKNGCEVVIEVGARPASAVSREDSGPDLEHQSTQVVENLQQPEMIRESSGPHCW